MNVLFVYPTYPDTFWSFKHALRFISKKAAFPPLGLLTVAAMLPETWGKRLADLNVEELCEADLDWADMVFVSAMLVQKKSALEVIERARAAGKIVVAGGPAPSAMPEAFSGAHHLVLGEAETTLPEFLRDLQAGAPKASYQNDLKPDVTRTPVPLWRLADFRKYASMAVQFSRGCPFNCEFCDIIVLNGRTPRTKDPDQMLGELDSLREAGWKGPVFIVDDNFIGNKGRVKAFLRELIPWQKKRRHPFQFFTEASLNLAQDEELMTLMSAANFNKVFLGIETPSLESLKECHKLQNTVQDMGEAIDAIHRNGMQVMGGFIVGFDSDTEDIFKAQLKFIQQTGIVTAMVGLLMAVPGTRLWKRLAAEGRLKSEASGENTDGSLNFEPIMDARKLVCGYAELVRSLYNPSLYYARVNTLLKKYKPTSRGRIKFCELKALIRSFWHIGLRSRARWKYWSLITRTALRRPRLLPVAVEMAIYGVHFEKCARRIEC